LDRGDGDAGRDRAAIGDVGVADAVDVRGFGAGGGGLSRKEGCAGEKRSGEEGKEGGGAEMHCEREGVCAFVLRKRQYV
jgi:hypothetical protein